MHVLNVDRVVHENPYTGDRITTAFIVNIDSICSPNNVPKSTEPAPLENNSTTSSKLPSVVAIKYLSDCRKVWKKSANRRSHGDWSSSDDSDDSEGDDGQDSDDEVDRLLAIREFPLGQIKVPEGIKFGVKARREIRALKAAQGHPNVVPFLGFTGPCIENPIAEDGPSDLPPTLWTSPGGQQTHHEESVLGFGRPLFGGSTSISDPQEASASILHTGLSFQLNHAALSESEHYNHDSDDDQVGHNYHNHNDSVAKDVNYWRRVFDRQPRPGGIILPFAPITLHDLIWIGWTRTRPLLVELCMRQILAGLEWIHEEARLIHRDISSGNILVSVASGMGEQDQRPGFDGNSGIVQCMISDFGCATPYDGRTRATEKSSYKNDVEENSHGFTFEVGTRAYRAPELLFSSGDYSTSVDIWSAGVLFAEMFLGRTLFEADSDIGQVCSIVKVLGTPTEENWPEYSTMPDYGKLLFKSLDTTPLGAILRPQPVETPTDTDSSPTLISNTALELIERMIVYSGRSRMSAREALAYKDRYLDGSLNKDTREYWLDIDTILDEKRRLREKLADEDEDGGYGYTGGSRSPGYGYGYFSRDNDDDHEEEEFTRYHSDDLYGEEDASAVYDTAPIPLAGDSGNQGGASENGHEDHDEERSPKRRR